MKDGRERGVPLLEPALAILRKMAELKDGSGLCSLACCATRRCPLQRWPAVLRRMGRGDLTAHGLRSTLRDWAAETTHHPNHDVARALACDPL